MNFFLSFIFISFLIFVSKIGANDVTSFNKYFLKYKNKYCLYPENLVDSNKFEITTEECDKITYENENKVLWTSYGDNKLRSENNMCLKTYKNFLVISICSPNPNDKSEQWKIDDEFHLRNGNDECAQIAGKKLFVFKCNKLSTIDFELKKYSLEEFKLMKTMYNQKKLQNVNKEHIEELNKKSSVLIETYKDVKNIMNQILENENVMKKKKEGIINLMGDIKMLLNTVSNLKEYGTGVLMKVYDSMNIKDKESILNISLDKLEITEDILNEIGIERGEIKIIIESYLNVPFNDEYTFTADNIKGNLLIKLNNEEIISNNNLMIDTKISSSLITLPRNKLIPIYIELSAKNMKPTFTLYWSSKNLPEQVITFLYLYTTINDKICYPQIEKKINCSTTFENIKNSEINLPKHELQFLCPSNCSANNNNNYSIFTNNNMCFDLKSSICTSAIVSKFLTNDSPGLVRVMLKKEKNENGELEECGYIIPTNTNDSSFNGITDIKLIDTDDFFLNYEKNKDIYTGYKGVITDDTHAILSKTDTSKRYISDIDIKCNNGKFDKTNLRKNIDKTENNENGYEIASGSFIIKRVKSNDITKTNEPVVIDVFALFDKYSNNNVDITLPNWNRKSCDNIQLFIKYGKKNDIMDYPSILLSCEDKFEDISFQNNTIIAKCLAFCNKKQTVYGSYIYAPNSYICSSAIHSGIITSNGGLIEITKLENIMQSFEKNNVNIIRNDIEAIIKKSHNKEFYYISKPNGIACNFPRNSYIINESLNSINLNQEMFSFFEKQNYYKHDTPPVSLVTMKHAVLQNQMDKLYNVYNKESYKNKYFLNNNINDNINNNVNDNNDIKLEFLKLKNNYENEKDNIKNITQKTTNMFSSLKKSNYDLKNIYNKLSNIKNEQNNYDEFLKQKESEILLYIKQFNIITQKKKNIILQLEKSYNNLNQENIETYKENYKSANINDNYQIIDSINNIKGPSNWKIEKFNEGNYFSSISNDSPINSNKYIYGSYIVNKYIKVYKGFITADIKISYNGNIGIIFKYKDNNNYSNFILNNNEIYFIDVINGNATNPINKKYIKNIKNVKLGEWVNVFIDFGRKNVRAYFNNVFVNGYVTNNNNNNNSGLVGFGVNNCLEKIYIDKIVIGSLNQEKYYKKKTLPYKKEHTFISNNVDSSLLNYSKKEENDILNIENKNDINNTCKIFEEKFHFPLEVNWLLPVNSHWTIKNPFNIKNILKKTNNQDSYLYVSQYNNGDVIVPSILFLKKEKFCDKINSFIFKSLINLNENSKAGIIFRAFSTLDFLSFIIDTSEPKGKIYLMKITDGNPYQLITPTHVPIKKQTWYNLEIHYLKTKIKVILDDEIVMDAKLNEQTDDIGNLGLIVLSGEANFKNIVFMPNA